jgi:glycosyltransferase involved in cell wall biosynthesis
MTPAVSVCVPAYDHAAFIGATIESVLAQSLRDFELIVCDDRSTDGTADVVARFRDPRITFVRNERNLGAAANWNRVVRMARAPFVKLLCDDDLLYPTCLERQAAVLADARNADVELVCCKRDIIDAGGRRLFTRAGFGATAGRIAGPTALRRIVRAGANLVGEPVAAMFRASALSTGEPFDERDAYMIDLGFWCKLLGRGSVFVIADALCAFRVSDAAWSTRLARSQAAQGRRFFRRMLSDAAAVVGPRDVIEGSVRATGVAVMRQLLYAALRVSRGS